MDSLVGSASRRVSPRHFLCCLVSRHSTGILEKSVFKHSSRVSEEFERSVRISGLKRLEGCKFPIKNSGMRPAYDGALHAFVTADLPACHDNTNFHRAILPMMASGYCTRTDPCLQETTNVILGYKQMRKGFA